MEMHFYRNINKAVKNTSLTKLMMFFKFIQKSFKMFLTNFLTLQYTLELHSITLYDYTFILISIKLFRNC